MTLSAALALLLAAWIAAGLLVARCCGINQRIDPPQEPTPMPLTPNDINEATDHAAGALARIETLCLALLSGAIPQAEGRAELERAYADLAEYQGLLIAYASTLTLPPAYYPGSLKANVCTRRIGRRSHIVRQEV